jgi:hypothetical protein
VRGPPLRVIAGGGESVAEATQGRATVVRTGAGGEPGIRHPATVVRVGAGGERGIRHPAMVVRTGAGGEPGIRHPATVVRTRAGGEPGIRHPATVARIGASGERGRGFVASALATAGAWLVEPAEPPGPEPEAAVRAPPLPRVVVAVFGLAPGCGATVVARALAAELAARDPGGTAAVACEARTSGIPLATQAASRLARALEDLPGAATRALGRLCLIEGADQLTLAESSRQIAPLVLDAGSTTLGGVPASMADRTVLVATPAVEPALARVAAECVARVGAESIVVLNRPRPGDHPGGTGSGDETDGADARAVDGELDDDPTPSASGFLPLPDSRLGAQLALGGREARGELGRAIARLADRCEGIA